MKNKVFFLLGSLIVMTLTIQAQEVKKDSIPAFRNSFWFDLGYGLRTGDGEAVTTGFGYEFKPNRFFSVRVTGVMDNCRCDEAVLFIPISHPIGRDVTTIEVGYGLIKKKRFGMFNFSFGLNYAHITEGESTSDVTSGSFFPLYFTTCPDDFVQKEKDTFGIFIRGEIMPTFRFAGISMSPSLFITPEYTYGMLTFHVVFGKLNPRRR